MSVLDRMLYKNVQFDCYCLQCKKTTPFKTERRADHYEGWKRASNNDVLEDDIFTLHMHCQRDAAHVYSYVFISTEDVVVKIGQFPSLEDIAASDLQRFRPVLEKEYFSELHRAGGLASHGIGIGSFVYLRRIFERLIVTHRDKLAEVTGKPIDGFDGLRMDEKIDALKSVLPATLVKNKSVYGILSKGIHELDEETCKKYFPIVRAAIIAMLEEDLQALEKKRAADELTKALGAISGELSGSK
ncbi:MAG: hypothetical protein AAAC48_19255 [Phyllobacterium sp.]|uniref:hypothetical protein n=1 Tax=Phyllobacterium sp. TaxID=1871046 RepID=UPI0030F2C157